MAIVRKALVKSVALEPKIRVVKDGSPTVVEVGEAVVYNIAMRACPEVVVCGQVITYTILMNNGAKEAMRDIRLVDVLPEALRFVSGSPCVDGDIQCDVKRIEDIRIPNLEPGCHHMISYKAFIEALVPYVANYATVLYVQGDSPVGFNVNSNTVVVKVEKYQ